VNKTVVEIISHRKVRKVEGRKKGKRMEILIQPTCGHLATYKAWLSMEA